MSEQNIAREHHLMCLGLLVKLWRESRDRSCLTYVKAVDQSAIEQAIESAEALGLPVSAKNLRSGLPVCKNSEN